MPNLRIVFAGTSQFASVILQKLYESKHSIVTVYTQPDRPSGRGQKLNKSAVKILSEKYKVALEQPPNFSDSKTIESLRLAEADIMVVASYGLILPDNILKIPKYGCINIHASLLPIWRGAAPIQRAIENGDDVTGITIIQMNKYLDEGNILSMSQCPIAQNDTSETLEDKLSLIGAECALETIDKIVSNKLKPAKQDHNVATYAKKIKKDEAWINWNENAAHINRKIRAFVPWPVAQTHLNDEIIRIWDSELVEEKPEKPIGYVQSTKKNGIDVCAKQGLIRIKRLQKQNGNVISAKDFLNAHDLKGKYFK
ncbi:MAG: methionyl-tRNA formyltransferase [Pseudomonadota bacterium]